MYDLDMWINRMPEPARPFIVLDTAIGDVNGDRVPDRVFLVGTKPYGASSPLVADITVVVEDGRTKQRYRIPLEQNQGYGPTLFLGDFTGDKVADIMVNMSSGGSGGITYNYVYSFLNNQPRKLFDSEQFNRTHTGTVTYEDYYKVRVVTENPHNVYILDIRYKGTDYLNEIYDPNGKLKAPLSGDINGLGGLYPVDFDYDGVYELMAFQRIIGRYNADGLGLVMNVQKWKGDRFTPFNQWIAING
ncbi:VCBS repeat-containing protein [Aneurinibacillus uraniidurans]|uniref:VCBS repeat-containing protein n=1 Tax=Aneurinibacillus uraniidurans TaxID=2966586 RepID=UPI00234AEE27|nr:VCBS repeat-containing protein [Aneurinibacillus sp. B1]WCN39447.1 VCBS repeat-containing protein [Aneurinibacillus sp. B1]